MFQSVLMISSYSISKTKFNLKKLIGELCLVLVIYLKLEVLMSLTIILQFSSKILLSKI